MASALTTEPCASATDVTRPATISEKYSAAPNFSAIAVSGGANSAIRKVATVPAKNEPIAAIASAGAGAAVARHLVAVDRGDGRGGFARHVDQDGGGRAAILRAVIDAGEHDQRGDRLADLEGDRQQHGDGRRGADARQHADQRAEQHADQAEEQVGRVGGGGEAERQIVEEFHLKPNPTTGSQGPKRWNGRPSP